MKSKVIRLDLNAKQTAYALSQLSRSANSIDEIVGKAVRSSTEGLTRIVDGYGHGSVRGMGHAALVFEDVDMYTAMRFFYMSPLADGQELSTRYVKFDSAKTPQEKLALDTYKDLYPHVLKYLEQKFGKQSNARCLDCLRYLLPMSLTTRFGAVMSGREWARYASREKNNHHLVDVFKEDDVLVRHNDYQALPKPLVTINPVGDYEVQDVDPSKYFGFSNRKDDHHLEYLRLPEGRSLMGWIDVGSLKDINRHRCLTKYIPFLHGQMPLQFEFSIHPYLIGSPFEDLIRQAYRELEGGIVETKDLLHGQKVPYIMSGVYHDWRYVLALRNRGGGHFAYKEWAYNVSQLIKTWSGYEAIDKGLIRPVVSREEYEDRQ